MQKKVTALHLRLHENKKTHKVMRSRILLGLVNRTKLYTVCTMVFFSGIKYINEFQQYKYIMLKKCMWLLYIL